MNNLLLADLHLTDNPIDEYRWDIFDWVKEVHKKYPIYTLYILGDLTDKKDNHSAMFVNRLTDNICSLSEEMDVVILKGNHDAINLNNPFFKFFNEFPTVTFISSPCVLDSGLFIPYTKDFKSVEDVIGMFANEINHEEVRYIFTHLPLIGSKVQNGWELKEGVDASIFNKYKDVQVFAGDIHSPQKIGNVEYIGSPYHITFSDVFNGQAILLDTNSGRKRYLKPSFLKRHSLKVSSPKELAKNNTIKKGDQIKIKVELAKEELYLWDKYRQEIKDYCDSKVITLVSLGMILKQVLPNKDGQKQMVNKETPLEIIKRFSLRENLDEEFITIAMELIC